MQSNVFCLIGPTASGKTALAMDLVSTFPFEIISVDSAMIYREMNIGTAKPSIEELKLFPHHLIDIRNPDEVFSVAEFRELVIPLCKDILQRGKLPLLVGGTCLYFAALQKGLAELPEKSETLRQNLLEEAKSRGWESLHRELLSLDPRAALKIHPQDKQRIQRALEVIRLTGNPLSSYYENIAESSGFRFQNLLLMPEERAWLHERISQRFELMLSLGFVDEVEALLNSWPLTEAHPSMRAVGYRQAREYLAGLCDYVGFCEKAKAATRQLAKRQLTWLRHWDSGKVFLCDDSKNKEKIIEVISKILDNRIDNIEA